MQKSHTKNLGEKMAPKTTKSKRAEEDLNVTLNNLLRDCTSRGTIESPGELGFDLDKLDKSLEVLLLDLAEVDIKVESQEKKEEIILIDNKNEYTKVLNVLIDDMSGVVSTHAELMEKFQEVGWTARRIGGDLKQADDRRLRAKGLILCLCHFFKTSFSLKLARFYMYNIFSFILFVYWIFSPSVFVFIIKTLYIYLNNIY